MTGAASERVGESARARQASLARRGLGALFLCWLYGVPFLLVSGLIRRTSTPYTPTREAARAFGATTDALLIAGLVLNVVLPLAGLLLAGLAGDGYWRRHFAGACAALVVVYLAVALAGGTATSPLVGHVPADQEQTPRVSHCVPISGGRGCPGG
ncbi:hypothetical protein [Micromonospora sp. WMMD812]|uniref:hypothetical protein n=1 Tax=Micromonospora sp. WMMD812 TaxID=3015152 RepID=UPI00248BFAE1|nr:hypothetical protein [Micromonospora sp. WMMD812]WBB66643.1 hypothetical protein O7603_26395 [Micromonospora sp. WMMD812]